MEIQENPRIVGKVVIVTGASSGIGEAAGLAFAQAGAKVILAARRGELLERLAQEISEAGGTAIPIPTDLRDFGQIQNLVRSTLDRFGRIDVLANIAGVSHPEWFDQMTPDELQEQYEVNLLGLAELTRQVVPVMKAQGEGHIINVSSFASQVALPSLAVYSSTKNAVDALSDSLRRELIPWGIEVSRVHPSSVSDAGLRVGKVHFAVPGLMINSQQVAKQIVELVESPRRAVFLSPFYEIPVFFLSRFPDVTDWLSSIWVRWKQRSELPAEIQPAIYARPAKTQLAILASGFLFGLMVVGKLVSKKR